MNSLKRHPARMAILSGSLVCIMAWSALMAQTKTQSEPQKRAPIPTASAIRINQEKINQAFVEQFTKSKTSKDVNFKREFAKQLLTQGQDPANDLSSRYVCLLESRTLMEAAGDLTGTLQAIDALGETFAVDSLQLQAASLRTLAVKPKQDHSALATRALQFARDAEKEAKFEVVIDLVETGFNSARKSKSKELIKLATELKETAPELKPEFDAYLRAKSTLTRKPDDPEANSVAGRYVCLVEGNWAKGGPMLLKGNDLRLKILAQREAEIPSNVQDAVKLADAWQALAEHQKGSFKTRMLREAVYWYEVAEYESTGLQKVTCQKMMEQVAIRSPRIPTEKGLIKSIYDGADFNKLRLVHIMPILHEDFSTGPAAPGLRNDDYSVIWQTHLKVPESGVYSISLLHDDAACLYIDDVCQINERRVGTDVRNIQLTAGFHPLRLEFKEFGGTAGTYLKWKRAGSSGGFEVVPETCFFHDQQQARIRGAKKP